MKFILSFAALSLVGSAAFSQQLTCITTDGLSLKADMALVELGYKLTNITLGQADGSVQPVAGIGFLVNEITNDPKEGVSLILDQAKLQIVPNCTDSSCAVVDGSTLKDSSGSHPVELCSVAK